MSAPAPTRVVGAHAVHFWSFCFLCAAANLYAKPFVVVDHVVHSGRKSRLLRRYRDGVNNEVLHQQLFERKTMGKR